MSAHALPDTMLAIVATPDGSQPTDRRSVPLPEPAPNEALVAVRAFAVNRGELTLLRIRGDGWRPGQDVAGEVVRAAADGSGPAAGMRVAGLAESHGWAQYATVPAHRLAAIPDPVDYVHAAALPMAGTTALGLVEAGGALLGRHVLVTGASGGVGHLAVQLAAGAGARVTAIARTEHAERLHAWGAELVAAAIADVDVQHDLILESAGGASLRAAINLLAPSGTVLLFGNSSGEPTTLGFFDFIGHGEARLATYVSSEHERLVGQRLTLLLERIARAALEVEVGLAASWDAIDDALAQLAARRVSGKVVLTVG